MKLVVKYKINSLYKRYVKQGSMKMLHPAIFFSGRKEHTCVECSKRQTVFAFCCIQTENPCLCQPLRKVPVALQQDQSCGKNGAYNQNQLQKTFPKLVENDLIISSANISYSVWYCQLFFSSSCLKSIEITSEYFSWVANHLKLYTGE